MFVDAQKNLKTPSHLSGSEVEVTSPLARQSLLRRGGAVHVQIGPYVLWTYLTVKGTARASMVSFLPRRSAMGPVGRAPMQAPMGMSEPIHEPSSSVMGRNESSFMSFSSVGAVQASTVPAASAPSEAARNCKLSQKTKRENLVFLMLSFFYRVSYVDNELVVWSCMLISHPT